MDGRQNGRIRLLSVVNKFVYELPETVSMYKANASLDLIWSPF